jgi:hypothetical protein
MVKLLFRTALVVAILAVAAFATNPSPEAHRAAIRKDVADRSPLAGVLGVGALTAFASTYHSLGVASYTVVNGKTVSFGAFHMVFIVEQ